MSRRETTASALGRLHADVEEVRHALAAGRAALPRLAMGSDDQAVVHIGLDAAGDVVQLDLSPGWRATIGPEGLGEALTEALQHAAEVRTGDWADGVAAATAGGRPDRTPAARAERLGRASDRSPSERGSGAARPTTAGPGDAVVAPIGVVRIDAQSVTVDPVWAGRTADEDVRAEVLRGLGLGAADVMLEAPAPLPRDVRALEERTHDDLVLRIEALPAFLGVPVLRAIDRVHADIVEALALPVVGEASAGAALRDLSDQMGRCRRLAGSPVGLPDAADLWAVAAERLTAALAELRTPARAGWWLRRGRSG